MEKVIPRGLFIVCVILMSIGLSGMIRGSLKWGITAPENALIIIGFISLAIVLFDIIYGLIKKKKSKD